MRRALVIGLVMLVSAGALAAPADAAKKKPRKAEEGYIAGPGLCCSSVADQSVGGAIFPTQPGENFIDVVVEDVSGLPAPSFVGQNADGDNEVEGQFFCGEINDVAIQGGLEVSVFVIASPVCIPDLTPGLGTTGTITAAFSAKP